MRFKTAVWLAGLLGGVGICLPVASAADWRTEDLGVAVNAVAYENSRATLGPGPGGRGEMFYTSYFRSTGAELLGYDYRTGASIRKKLPSAGGYGVTRGKDGCIYVGGVYPGNLHQYDPKSDKLVTFKAPNAGCEYIWELEAAPDGKIYCAAGFPRTNLLVFDPEKRELRDLGEMATGEQYLRSLCIDPLGKVWCGVGMHAHLVVYNPADGSKREVLPAEFAGNSSVYELERVGDYVVASVLYGGTVLVYDAASQKVVRTIPRPAGQQSWMIAGGSTPERTYLWTLPGFDAYACNLRSGELTKLAEHLGKLQMVEQDRVMHVLQDQEYVAYDLREKRVLARQRLTEGGDGMDVFTLASGPDGNVYGSTYINMHMFRCETATGKLVDLGRASRWPGQVDSLSLGGDGRLYVGAYIEAVVSVLDPKAPWNPGQEAGSNPREINPVGKGQYRTRANCLGPDGRVYVGSVPAYNTAPTGAFTICDPKTGRMDARTDFVKGGTVHTLVADDQYVYGAGGGEFFVYDPATGSKHWRVERPVVSLAVLPGGRVLGSGGGKVFVYDRAANAITLEKANPTGDFSHMATGPDGAAYGVGDKAVARVNANGEVDILAKPGGRFAAVDKQGRVYFARGSHVLRASQSGQSGVDPKKAKG
jgi:outer membrane protein assembly factor BamB